MECQTLPILSVKFKIPEPRKKYVSRKNLMERLSMLDKKVTIVKAGAGSGKTTLLSSYIKENNTQNVRWITMDANMNQVFIFWKYILEGTKDFLGETFKSFQNLFDGNVQKDNLWQILSLYMNKMYQGIDIVLVLDDFQVIDDDFLISTLDFFIANMPDNLHLVLITRVIPKIYLGAISMEDQLLLIEEQDIRMTEQESREFLLHTLSIDIDEDKIRTMINSSNGWVGGLQLMAVAAKEQSQNRFLNINAANRLIDDYITNEIYRFLSKEERDFLKITSILGYFNQNICEKLIPQYDFHKMMGSILNKNLFVVSIDEENRVYRYHSIMKDYLNNLFDKEMEQKTQLHNKAADIYYEIGDFDESLYHLFTIQAYKKIMIRLLKMPQTVFTFSYMMKVPLEEIAKNTDFAYQYFFCHYASMDVAACERIYDFIIKNMQEDETVAAFKHSDLFFNVNWKFKNIASMTFAQIDAMPLNEVTKAYLFIKEAYFLFLADQCSEAFLYLDKAHEIYEHSGNAYIEAFVLAEKSQILEENGEFKKALLLYKKMEKFLEVLPTLAPSYYIGIAGVYIRQLALEKARDALIQAKEHMKFPVENVENAYQYTIAEYFYVIGEHEKTEKIIIDLADKELYQNIYFIARLLRYPIYRGNHKELAEKFVKDYELADDMIKNLDTYLLYAGILYENGESDKASILIDTLIARARKTQNKLKIVEGALLKIRIKTGQKYSAREIINIFIEAVSYAYEYTIAVPFWFERETVMLILNQYQEELIKKLSAAEYDFIKNIMKIEKDKGLDAITEKEYDLTERELEVLEEMKKGYSNKQIAEQLYISLATVKSHVINIYGKLGVNNRVAAINKIN